MAERRVEVLDVDPHGRSGAAEAYAALCTAVAVHELGDRASRTSADDLRAQALDPGSDRSWLLAVDASGTAIGAAGLRAPHADHLDTVVVELVVDPARRRQGVGTLLLAAVEQRAARLGRDVVWVQSVLARERTEVTAFAQVHGYTAALRSVRQELDVADRLDPGPVPPDGYRVVTAWDGLPEPLLAGRAHLAERMSADVETGGLALAEEVWDAERVRVFYATSRAQGRRLVETLALAPGGEPVAFTTLVVRPQEPAVAMQRDTYVLGAHRGRRLGLRVKAANLDALTRELPQVRRVVTWNALDNEPVLRVNDALGFGPAGVRTDWQRRLT